MPPLCEQPEWLRKATLIFISRHSQDSSKSTHKKICNLQKLAVLVRLASLSAMIAGSVVYEESRGDLDTIPQVAQPVSHVIDIDSPSVVLMSIKMEGANFKV